MLMRSVWVSLALLVVALAAPGANAVLVEIEDAFESSTELVILPAGGVGNLIVRECGTCKTITLLANARTRAFVGNQEVPFDEMRSLAESLTAPVYVFYTADDKLVTRVILDVN